MRAEYASLVGRLTLATFIVFHVGIVKTWHIGENNNAFGTPPQPIAIPFKPAGYLKEMQHLHSREEVLSFYTPAAQENLQDRERVHQTPRAALATGTGVNRLRSKQLGSGFVPAVKLTRKNGQKRSRRGDNTSRAPVVLGKIASQYGSYTNCQSEDGSDQAQASCDFPSLSGVAPARGSYVATQGNMGALFRRQRKYTTASLRMWDQLRSTTSDLSVCAYVLTTENMLHVLAGAEIMSGMTKFRAARTNEQHQGK